jgi:RNA polymerase sigma factor (sigma-70 family)
MMRACAAAVPVMPAEIDARETLHAPRPVVAMCTGRAASWWCSITNDLQPAVGQFGLDESLQSPCSAVRTTRLPEQHTLARFEEAVLPHLAAAYNVARWLTRNDHDAEDVVQEAYVRALKFFGGFHGGDSRAWLLAIVRNTCYTWLQHNRPQDPTTEFDEEVHSLDSEAANPETLLLHTANTQWLRQALEALPVEFREVVIWRELEGLSYKEIAEIANIPIGTVMSRLARARKRLQQSLQSQAQGGLR